jgi:hypothetical protein
LLDLLRRLRQSGSAVGVGELDPEILWRIVARGEIHGAHRPAAPDLEGEDRRRNGARGDLRAEAFRLENPCGLGGESFRQKARVVSDEDEAPLMALFGQESRDRRDDTACVGEGELLRDDRSPPGGPEPDRRVTFLPGRPGRTPPPAVVFPGAS